MLTVSRFTSINHQSFILSRTVPCGPVDCTMLWSTDTIEHNTNTTQHEHNTPTHK